VPGFLDERFEGLDENPEERAAVAADVAAEQIEDLYRRGIRDIHLYTMNRSPLIGAVLERLGFRQDVCGRQRAGAAA
jgi:methylenetetrahydrofolate reductase (NADPH)